MATRTHKNTPTAATTKQTNNQTTQTNIKQMVAAYAGQLEAVTLLLDEGFCIEERDARLRTPIHAATKAGHINVRAFW